MRCLCDLDGVLVDLLTGWLRKRGLKRPVPWPHGIASFDKIFNIQPTLIWEGCDETFWAELPKMHDADKLIDSLGIKFRRSELLLITSVVANPIAAAGKIHWIAKNYPSFGDRYIITPSRESFADSNTVLIDDQLTNCLKFRKAGGHAIQVPRVWNERYDSAHESWATVIHELCFLIARAEHPV